MKRIVATLLAVVLMLGAARAQDDPLPSWNDGPHKKRILAFVEAVTTEGGKQYVKPEDRVATFDNDGTLWCEQPMYTQVIFAFDRVRNLAKKHPEWKTAPPFKYVLDGDMRALMASGEKGIGEIMLATHAGMTPEQFREISALWLKMARHPRFKLPFTSLVYQPQLELMKLLRDRGFKVYIVTGGGMAFVRVFSEKVYEVPRESVVGSSLGYTFRASDHQVVRDAKVGFIDDGPGKPIGIQVHIGRRPILAFGNSDGDLQMLQYAAAGKHPYLALLLHHDDAVREYAYDRKSVVGKLDKAWDAAVKNGWIVVSMKNDFKTIFPKAP